jgi:8-oxo-dGTP diphosphatase
VIRHFTASAVVLDGDQVLLVHHRKLGVWLQPGGHIEPNEDPVQAVRREVREEVGLDVEILGEPRFSFSHPEVSVIDPPFTILVEDIDDPTDGRHQHIDLIYVCRPASAAAPSRPAEYDGKSRWVPVATLRQLDTTPELPPLIEAAAAYAATFVTSG